jgi:hypothetical protein
MGLRGPTTPYEHPGGWFLELDDFSRIINLLRQRGHMDTSSCGGHSANRIDDWDGDRLHSGRDGDSEYPH